MTLSTALFIFAAQLLAYLVKGLIGFGNPLISAPILSMSLDNVVITPGTLLLDCPVNAWKKVLTLPDASHPRTRVDIDNLRGFCYPINQ